ncbi:MAG: transketolase family protein [Breznakia sp.]
MGKTATREAYGKALADVIVKHPDVVVLDADLTKSTKTIEAKNACADRHFNMGIAEGNMMAVAAGLAASNKVVYASTFAMFAAGRAFEQVRNSIGYPHLNVKVCATHAGLTVGEDGASHQSVEDLSLMRSIPGMKVFQPCDAKETDAIIHAIKDIDGPCYVRLGRGAVEDVFDDDYTFEMGKGKIIKRGEKIALVATGMMVQEALKACERLTCKPTLVNIHTIKPIDEALLVELAKTHDTIITCEEHSVIGGLGSAVAEVLTKHNLCKQVMIGIKDTFGESGTPAELIEKYEIDADAIVKAVENEV